MPLGFTDGQSLEIRVLFPAGEGLQEGDPVRYRGISVGEVTSVELASDAEAVAVGVRLVGASRELARVGTQFWIERPRLDLTEVRGLETLIGGRYIAMQPTTLGSPGNAQVSGEFTGLAEPPPLPRRDGSLEIELDASRRLGIVRGAPSDLPWARSRPRKPSRSGQRRCLGQNQYHHRTRIRRTCARQFKMVGHEWHSVRGGAAGRSSICRIPVGLDSRRHRFCHPSHARRTCRYRSSLYARSRTATRMATMAAAHRHAQCSQFPQWFSAAESSARGSQLASVVAGTLSPANSGNLEHRPVR
jgi:hypothetical protein